MSPRFPLAACLALCMGLPAMVNHGSPAAPDGGGPALARAARTFDLDLAGARAVRAGIDLLYGLDYAGALASFAALLPAWRDHPAPWFFLGMVRWMKLAALEGDAGDDEALERILDKAVAAADARRAAGGPPAPMLFYRAGALGFLARRHYDERRWARALVTGWDAYRTLQRAAREPGTTDDVYLGLGFFQYTAGRMPAGLRAVAAALGVAGDWRLGLAQLERAASNAAFASTEARLILAHLYAYEQGRPDRAVALLAPLVAAWPGNPLFAVVLGDALCLAGRFADAARVAADCLERARTGTAPRAWTFRALVLAGRIAHARGDWPACVAFHDEALALADRRPPRFVPWAYLRRGDAWLARGDRDKAAADWRRAVDHGAGLVVAVLARGKLLALQVADAARRAAELRRPVK